MKLSFFQISKKTLLIVGNYFIALGNFIRSFEKKVDSNREDDLLRWHTDRGDQTLRLAYRLDQNSIVFDVGGYQGQWASDIFSMYQCDVHVFEPVPEFADNIRKRFIRNTKIKVYDFGLSNTDETATISVNADSSSVLRNVSEQTREIRLKTVPHFCLENQIKSIDLMKINIEGGEYALLNSLIESGFITQIENIQVQFHTFVPQAEERMKKIQSRLSETHQLTYQYEFVWENWALK